MAAVPATGIVWFTTPDDPDPQFALYQCGQWWVRNRWRGWILKRRRSRQPYLDGGAGRRMPVQVLKVGQDGAPCAA